LTRHAIFCAMCRKHLLRRDFWKGHGCFSPSHPEGINLPVEINSSHEARVRKSVANLPRGACFCPPCVHAFHKKLKSETPLSRDELSQLLELYKRHASTKSLDGSNGDAVQIPNHDGRPITLLRIRHPVEENQTEISESALRRFSATTEWTRNFDRP